jgi:hypothetical protein
MIRKNKERTVINLTVIGIQRKYIIPKYFLLKLKKLVPTGMSLAKYIQYYIVDKFSSKKFLIENGFTMTVNELIFDYLIDEAVQVKLSQDHNIF